jgi:hypothetical protein
MSLEGVHICMENLDEAIEVVRRGVEKLERIESEHKRRLAEEGTE